ncbi:imelysin family protein [Pseudofulvibacter geojedonensis]|uniref:Imelysin family protein n=1 Tax=Pseudofulvibacter geojedonensis TaxID=1123758 RepID=A0ABW3I2I0_9FLAO
MKKFLAILVLTVLVWACSSDNGSSGGGNTDNFDRAAMLTNWADNIIIPAYTDYENKLTALQTATTNFTTIVDQTNLDALRTAWLEAYKTWQYVILFSDFSKAAELNVTRWVNRFPTDVTGIETNITNNFTDLTLSSTNVQQGFPALDYLLYGVAADDTAILAKYDSEANAANYKNYLTAVVNRLKDLNTPVLNHWNSGYRNIFIGLTENTNAGGVNILVNDYIYNYEKYFRKYKLGDPLGIFTGNGVEPTYIESRYGKKSKELLLVVLSAIEDFFSGKHYNSAAIGESFKTYLAYLDAKKDGQDLVPLMLAQMGSARTKLNGLDTDLSNQINTNVTPVQETYTEIQKLVPMLKIDMRSAFNVELDYYDNDGD